MIISYSNKQLSVHDEASLLAVLEIRDCYGGGEFWLSGEDELYPNLAIIVSQDLSYIIYFPEEGHPGFRCLFEKCYGENGEFTTFIWDGSDPSSGELVPNEFVGSFSQSILVAQEFRKDKSLPQSVRWFEL